MRRKVSIHGVFAFHEEEEVHGWLSAKSTQNGAMLSVDTCSSALLCEVVLP